MVIAEEKTEGEGGIMGIAGEKSSGIKVSQIRCTYNPVNQFIT